MTPGIKALHSNKANSEIVFSFRLVDMGIVAAGPGSGALSYEGNVARRSSAAAGYSAESASFSQEQKR